MQRRDKNSAAYRACSEGRLRELDYGCFHKTVSRSYILTTFTRAHRLAHRCPVRCRGAKRAPIYVATNANAIDTAPGPTSEHSLKMGRRQSQAKFAISDCAQRCETGLFAGRRLRSKSSDAPSPAVYPKLACWLRRSEARDAPLPPSPTASAAKL